MEKEKTKRRTPEQKEEYYKKKLTAIKTAKKQQTKKERNRRLIALGLLLEHVFLTADEKSIMSIKDRFLERALYNQELMKQNILDFINELDFDSVRREEYKQRCISKMETHKKRTAARVQPAAPVSADDLEF